MALIKDTIDAYVPASEVELQTCRCYVPDELYDFVLRCTSGDDYQNVTCSNDADRQMQTFE